MHTDVQKTMGAREYRNVLLATPGVLADPPYPWGRQHHQVVRWRGVGGGALA